MNRFQSILVKVDSRKEDHPELQWTARLAGQNQAKLKIVDVLPDLFWLAKRVFTDSDSTQEAHAGQKHRMLQTVAQPIRDHGVEVTTELLFGKTSHTIIHEVLRSGHDLVVRVTKGAHSGRNGFFGTTSMRLLRNFPCADWLVRTDTPPRFTRVLAAVDPAPNDIAQEILNKVNMDLGRSIAKSEEGQLHVVHVQNLLGETAEEAWSIPGKVEETIRKEKSEVAPALDSFLSPYKLSHNGDCVHVHYDNLGAGPAISELANYKQINLVVMGAIARTELKCVLIGNTAENVMDHIECSDRAIRSDNFTSLLTFPDELQSERDRRRLHGGDAGWSQHKSGTRKYMAPFKLSEVLI